jgi:hypothetical protein
MVARFDAGKDEFVRRAISRVGDPDGPHPEFGGHGGPRWRTVEHEGAGFGQAKAH